MVVQRPWGDKGLRSAPSSIPNLLGVWGLARAPLGRQEPSV